MAFQIREFFFKSAREDRESAPSLGIQILIIQMERWSVPLALPLVAAPELEETDNPVPHLPSVGFWEFN